MRMAKPGPERMAAKNALLDAQGTAHAAHLVFEEQPQRFHDLEFHEVWQTAHVVVALDRRRRTTCGTHRLNHVRVNGSLPQPPGAFHLVRRLVEHLNEHTANGLALGFGVGLAGQGLGNWSPARTPRTLRPMSL